jgi:hypothetical protein
MSCLTQNLPAIIARVRRLELLTSTVSKAVWAIIYLTNDTFLANLILL